VRREDVAVLVHEDEMGETLATLLRQEVPVLLAGDPRRYVAEENVLLGKVLELGVGERAAL